MKHSEHLPPLPFSFDEKRRYLKDANGRNIAVMWGDKAEATALAAVVVAKSKNIDPKTVVTPSQLAAGPLEEAFVFSAHGPGFMYVLDASQKRIVSCWCTMRERMAVAEYIINCHKEVCA